MLHPLVPAIFREADAGQDPGDRATGLTRSEAVEPRRVGEVLLGGHLLEERRLDGHTVDKTANLPGFLDDVVAEDRRAAAVREQQGREKPDERRLARAVLAQDGDALAALHGERHTLERCDAPPPFAHARSRRIAAEELLAQIVDLYSEHIELLRFGGTREREHTCNDAGGARGVAIQPKKSFMPSQTVAVVSSSDLRRFTHAAWGPGSSSSSSTKGSVRVGNCETRRRRSRRRSSRSSAGGRSACWTFCCSSLMTSTLRHIHASFCHVR